MYQDRVKETSTTTGTGNIALAGAAVGYRTFNSVYAVGEQGIVYVIDNLIGDWEVGLGHLSGATTLVRDTVYESSAGGGAFTNFPAGTKLVFVTYPAKEATSLAQALASRSGFSQA